MTPRAAEMSGQVSSRPRGRRPRGLLSLVGAALAARPQALLAQDAGGGGSVGGGLPAPREEDAAARQSAEERAEHVLAAARAASVATERLDLVAALGPLEDRDWLVRRYGAVRLRASGMPDALYQRLVPCSRPGSAAEEGGGAQARAEARTWGEEQVRAEPPLEREVTIADERLAVGLLGIAYESARAARDPAAEVRLALDLHAAIVARIPEERRLDSCRALFAGLRQGDVLVDLALAPDLRPRDCGRILEWYWSNRSYLYFHPGERRFALDRIARAAGTPSEAYRRTNPWGVREGPNALPESDPDRH